MVVPRCSTYVSCNKERGTAGVSDVREMERKLSERVLDLTTWLKTQFKLRFICLSALSLEKEDSDEESNA